MNRATRIASRVVTSSATAAAAGTKPKPKKTVSPSTVPRTLLPAGSLWYVDLPVWDATTMRVAEDLCVAQIAYSDDRLETWRIVSSAGHPLLQPYVDKGTVFLSAYEVVKTVYLMSRISQQPHIGGRPTLRAILASRPASFVASSHDDVTASAATHDMPFARDVLLGGTQARRVLLPVERRQRAQLALESACQYPLTHCVQSVTLPQASRLPGFVADSDEWIAYKPSAWLEDIARGLSATEAELSPTTWQITTSDPVVLRVNSVREGKFRRYAKAVTRIRVRHLPRHFRETLGKFRRGFRAVSGYIFVPLNKASAAESVAAEALASTQPPPAFGDGDSDDDDDDDDDDDGGNQPQPMMESDSDEDVEKNPRQHG